MIIKIVLILNFNTIGQESNLLSISDDTQVLTASSCKKDLGSNSRLRHWSRGHLFICRPCGHIDYWQPIYK